MKVSIGATIKKEPWGGGNQLITNLITGLEDIGVEVFTNLERSDLDIILLTEPDYKLYSSEYDHRDIRRYLSKTNPQCIVVHRINNSSSARDDTRKKFNKFRIKANKIADYTIFISNWLYQEYKNSGFKSDHYSIIYNGGKRIKVMKNPSVKHERIRLVTHHWSKHSNKGYDVYKILDDLLSKKQYSSKISFTHIGRLNDSIQLKNSKCIEPLYDDDLSKELSEHDIYLTAAINEAAGMHHIEGAMVGLPILYRDSGGIPEYCEGFGISFEKSTFIEKLNEMMRTYKTWASKLIHYPHTNEVMVENYYQLFEKLLTNKTEIITNRHRRNKFLQWFS